MDDSLLQALQHRAAIEEVRHRYGQALDFQDWQLLGSLLTEQVQTDFSEFGVPPQTVSKDALVRSFQHTLSRPGLKTQHIFTSFRIAVVENRATSVSNFVGYHFLAGTEGGEEFTLRAEYTDTLVRVSDRWQISGMACKVLCLIGNPKLLAS